MKKMLCLAVATMVIGLSGCGGETAPSLKADTGFICGNVNRARAIGETSAASNILGSALNVAQQEYTGDKPIELFFRNVVLKDQKITAQVVLELYQQCGSNAGESVTDVLSSVLTDFYKGRKENPYFALCSTYNSNDMTWSAVLAGIRQPRSYSLIAGDSFGDRMRDEMRAEKFDEETWRPGVDAFCKENPDARFMSAVMSVNNHKFEEKRKAEDKANQAEKDAKLAKIMDVYGKSLVGNGASNCFDLSKQVTYANENGAKYEDPRIDVEKIGVGLLASMNDMLAPRSYDEKQFVSDNYGQDVKAAREFVADVSYMGCASDEMPIADAVGELFKKKFTHNGDEWYPPEIAAKEAIILPGSEMAKKIARLKKGEQCDTGETQVAACVTTMGRPVAVCQARKSLVLRYGGSGTPLVEVRVPDDQIWWQQEGDGPDKLLFESGATTYALEVKGRDGEEGSGIISVFDNSQKTSTARCQAGSVIFFSDGIHSKPTGY